MKTLVVSQRRLFMAKAAWAISAPTVIGEIEDVVREILTSGYFKNGLEYIKELQGIKFVRVSKRDIERLLSNTPEQIELYAAIKTKI